MQDFLLNAIVLGKGGYVYFFNPKTLMFLMNMRNDIGEMKMFLFVVLLGIINFNDIMKNDIVNLPN
jgi:hypothetical protein